MDKHEFSLLIAEDEEGVRESIRAFLSENAPFIREIYTADNGQKALDVIFQYKPDIMLLDIKMPVKNGITVMEEASAAGVFPQTVVISGYDAFEFAQHAVRFGAVDYLLKPARSADILKAVNMAVERICGATAQIKPAVDDTGNCFINEAINYINRHYPEEITLPAVAEHIGITHNYLSTLFGKTLGYGFSDCLSRIRIEHSLGYFHDSLMKTYEIAFKVGFNDERYFSSVFKKIMGVSPAEYRKGLYKNEN